jgi:hypothetical protein
MAPEYRLSLEREYKSAVEMPPSRSTYSTDYEISSRGSGQYSEKPAPEMIGVTE